MKIYVITIENEDGHMIMAVAETKTKADILANIFSDEECEAQIEVFDTNEYSEDELPTYRVWFSKKRMLTMKRSVYASCYHAKVPMVDPIPDSYFGEIYVVTLQAKRIKDVFDIAHNALLEYFNEHGITSEFD